MHVSAGVSEDATLEASLEVERDMGGENNTQTYMYVVMHLWIKS